MNMNDTLFLFLCTLLVWLMTPGLSLFYGGLVQSKNVLNTVMQSMSAIVVVTFAWVILGFSLSFGPGNTIIGDFTYLGLKQVGFNTQDDIATHIPIALFMLFQLMFCTIAVSILSGSIAEKMKFIPYLIFVFLWVLLVYSPVAHWVWGGGWIHKLGAIDYAGGTVVHITSGVSGLVLALMIGAGKNFDKRPPHNLIITLVGGILVWVGWYGFNVGSALTFNDIAMTSFVNTVLAASAGSLGWLLIEYIMKKTTSLIGMLSGMLAGLVAITPSAGFVDYMSAIAIALIGGVSCYFAINYIKVKLKYNDALDAFGIHGIGGIIGAILTGVFQSHKVNDEIVNGLLFGGNLQTVWTQLIAVFVTVVFSGCLTFLIAKGITLFSALGTDKVEEVNGLDYVVHGERAYFSGELNKFNKLP
ncbi:MAG: ammonium transporter [Staphylococcus equorum]|uniref:ammonium transporter n=1 Tax=Staphylococcus TaxID=1279 RepID=UPI0008533857|nr:ammonium transporter [Staphylococcus equorum]MDG0822481.1 ammonium transporter [Staphylococcus equorum]MDG0837352.1 ammonium transporter [Staphylococcus equorum]MDK9872973.1 ammonium transporter [Staphylococcus equorum]MDK9877222.1 ammonium transporter [Staphylococcus equorum]MDN5829430.1 ammonium transporter [Staphylococcus equorum]